MIDLRVELKFWDSCLEEDGGRIGEKESVSVSEREDYW